MKEIKQKSLIPSMFILHNANCPLTPGAGE
jgi:hypothetical protein